MMEARSMIKKLSIYIHHQNSFYKLGIQEYIEQYCYTQNIEIVSQPSEINERGKTVKTIVSPASFNRACIYCLPGYKKNLQERQFISLSVSHDDISYVQNRVIHIGTLSKSNGFSNLEELLRICLDDTPCNAEEKKVNVFEGIPLTTQQLQVINYLKNGFSYKEIAIMMNITNKSVYAQKYAIMKKMSFKGKHDFISWILSE